MPKMASDPSAEFTHTDKSCPSVCCTFQHHLGKQENILLQLLAIAHGASCHMRDTSLLCLHRFSTSALALRLYTPCLVCHTCAMLFSCQRIHSHRLLIPFARVKFDPGDALPSTIDVLFAWRVQWVRCSNSMHGHLHWHVSFLSGERQFSPSKLPGRRRLTTPRADEAGWRHQKGCHCTIEGEMVKGLRVQCEHFSSCDTWKNISSKFATLQLVFADRRATARTTTRWAMQHPDKKMSHSRAQRKRKLHPNLPRHPCSWNHTNMQQRFEAQYRIVPPFILLEL